MEFTSTAKYRAGGLFLKSHETFWAYFGSHNPLYIFATPRFKAMKLRNPVKSVKSSAFQNKWSAVWQLASRACNVLRTFEKQGAGACFSKVPKGFRCLWGDKFSSVSVKQRCLEGQNFVVVLVFVPHTTYEKTSFTEQMGWSFTNGFSGLKSFKDFQETHPRPGK